MNQIEPNKDKVNHIVIAPFAPEEKAAIYTAVKIGGVRRTKFYHDAIVKEANSIVKENADDPADNS